MGGIRALPAAGARGQPRLRSDYRSDGPRIPISRRPVTLEIYQTADSGLVVDGGQSASIATYPLYLESGPRRRKTMVHVLSLLGCVVRGPTTEEAVAATPEGIAAYLRFLHLHGEPVDPDASFTVSIAEHITSGFWLGEGDPTPGFAPDHQPLSTVDLEMYRRRFDWLGDDLLTLLNSHGPELLDEKPASDGRPLRTVYQHAAICQANYLRASLGRLPDLAEALAIVRNEPSRLAVGLGEVWRVSMSRLTGLTEEQRGIPVQHGQMSWSARRALRRMLEHAWEHYQEIVTRLS